MNTRTDRRLKVLIVDDETNMRTTLGDILEDEGYEVRLATNGEEAVDLCASAEFDTLVMDYRMPGLNGLEAFRLIRRRSADARVILMSAYGAELVPLRALEEGVVAFLRKPLDVEQMLKLIAGVRDVSVLVAGGEDSVGELDEALRQLGYRTTVASDASKAIGLVEQIRYNLIFIDASFPSMGALKLYQAIRQRAPSAVAIILAGSESEEEVAREIIEQTAYTSIRKPIQRLELEHLVARLTGQLASGELKKPIDPESTT